MPIITPNNSSDPEFYVRLQESGAAVIREEAADHQDIRPARIGLLNLMPAKSMEGTELRWMRFISQTVLQIEPVLVKFDSDPRERPGASREKILDRYVPFSEVAAGGLDALIVTGDNRERAQDGSILPFDEILYSEKLREVIEWANTNVFTAIYSCLASQFALNSLHGINRRLLDKKIMGIFDHEVVSRESVLTSGLDDTIRSPHSRWCDVPVEEVIGASALRLIAVSEQVGWLLADEPRSDGGLNVYIQGHPEYWRRDLHEEYIRDELMDMPANYYRSDNGEEPQLTWANDARAIHANWIAEIYRSFSSNFEASN